MALLAVAPLFLFPFCGQGWISATLICLSLFAAVWVFVEPSRRANEMLHDARLRVACECAVDPLFWFSLVIVLFYAAAGLNGGVGMVYDAESSNWRLAGASAAFLPGSAEGGAGFAFSMSVALVVILAGCRHALGKTARIVFLLSGSFFSGVAALTAGVLCASGNAYLTDLAQCRYYDASFVGVAFGLWLMASMTVLVGLFEVNLKRFVPFLFIGLGGSAVGLFLFAPLCVVLLFVLMSVIVLIASLVYGGVKMSSVTAPKCLALLSVMLALPVAFCVCVLPPPLISAKISAVMDMSFFPEDFSAARDLLSSFALKSWSERPWLGSGMGSFPLNIRFFAGDADWEVITTWQKGALNGWLQLLSERGIIGMIMVISPFLFLLWTYILRFSCIFRKKEPFSIVSLVCAIHPACILGPLAVAAVALCGFVDYSFYRQEVYLAAASFFALAGSFFPVRRKKSEEDDSMNSEAENVR